MSLDRNYVLRRCIELLFSDFGQRRGIFEEISYSIYQDKINSLSNRSKVNFLVEILFLRKFLAFTTTFLNQIMPYIMKRLSSFTTKKFNRTRDDYIKGHISWTRTLLCEYQGTDTIVIENLHRQYTSPENLITVLTLLEIRYFSTLLHSDFRTILSHDSIEYQQLKDIIRKCDELLRMNIFQECQVIIKPFFINEKAYLQAYLHSNQQSSWITIRPKMYNYFINKIIQKIIGKKVYNPYYRKLLNWRQRFFSNAFFQFISDITDDYIDVFGEFEGNWTDSTLYELWILFEFLNSLAKNEKIFIKQNPTIPGGLISITREPLFFIHMSNENIENKKSPMRIYGVYYNKIIDRSRDQMNITSGGWALRNRPDILIIDLLTDKIIVTIDTKEYSNANFNVSPLKEMLGYMNNFKTELGIVIFSCLQKEFNANNLIYQSKRFTHIQDQDSLEELLVISLIPSKDNEIINSFYLNYKLVPTLEDHLLSKFLISVRSEE